jgi:hypothetical protein
MGPVLLTLLAIVNEPVPEFRRITLPTELIVAPVRRRVSAVTPLLPIEKVRCEPETVIA